MNGALFSIKSSTESKNIPIKTIIDILCFLAVIIVSSLWALLIFNKTAQAQEGWYVVYGNMILQGMVPYIDFEFLYLPLYAYMSALVVLIFGDSLLAFRAIGALLFVSIAVVVFFILRSITPSWIATIGSLISVFALQGDVFSYSMITIPFSLYLLIFLYFLC